MDKKQILKLLLKAVEQNQKLNGISDVRLEANTRPIGELERFDSLTALEVLTALEIELENEYELEFEFENDVFYTKMGKSAMTKDMTHNSLTIEEIADNIYNQMI